MMDEVLSRHGQLRDADDAERRQRVTAETGAIEEMIAEGKAPEPIAPELFEQVVGEAGVTPRTACIMNTYFSGHITDPIGVQTIRGATQAVDRPIDIAPGVVARHHLALRHLIRKLAPR